MNFRHILYHLVFWIIFLLALTFSEWGIDQSLRQSFNYHMLLLPGRLLTVYINWFILIPLFLYHQKRLYYFSFLFFLLILVACLHRYFVIEYGYPMFFPQWIRTMQDYHFFHPTRIIQHALAFFFPVAITTLFKISKDWFYQRKFAEELKQEKITAELKFLKSQTNPHFLFNTLNSIYGLSLENSPKTPNLILKLSDILSYTLYESDTKKTELRKEIQLIQNIIDLEKERYAERVEIEFNREGNIGDLLIPPLIFIPFVENSFKHGVKDEIKNAWIRIKVKAIDRNLYFEIENSKPATVYPSSEGGLGLKNIARRLELIYGNRQNLYIEDKKSSFLVRLSIKKDENEA